MALDLEWDRDLKHRRGGATRLDGIDVYYDFDWYAVFPDRRAQFRNGQCLAKRVRGACPEDKTPVLLLTDRDEVDEGYRETPLHLVFVLNLPRYLRTDADPSLSYVASRLGPGIARLGPLNEEAAARAEAGRLVLDSQLELEQIAAWAAVDPVRREQLRLIAGPDEEGRSRAGIGDIVAALEALPGDLDAEAVSVIARLFGPGTDRERRLELLRAVTDDAIGRDVAGEVLAERTPERVADARSAMADYQALLGDPDTNETRMQGFIEENLWLLGLDYAEMRPGQRLLLGEMDFLLERFDGFHDLLELKSPRDEIIRVRGSDGGVAPSPSAYALSPDLAQALAQVHVYRDRLTRHAEATEDLVGLPLTRDPVADHCHRQGRLPAGPLQAGADPAEQVAAPRGGRPLRHPGQARDCGSRQCRPVPARRPGTARAGPGRSGG